MKTIKNMNSTNKRTIIELFAGAGGMAIASEKAGFKHLMLNEIDKHASNTLKENRPHWNVINKDINDILEEATEYKNVDIISGGFPCQAFSYAGKRKGFEDARGTLFYSYAKFVQSIKPKVFLIENVQGMVKHDGGKTLETILETMGGMGYKIKWQVMNSFEYGVPQKRKRIIIIGFLNEKQFENFEWPKKSEKKLVLRDALKNVPKSVGSEYPESKRKVLELVPPGGCWRDLPDDVAREYMKKSYFLGGGKTGMARRISWDEPSLTLTTSPMQKQTERCHPDETRPFTTREYARIQTFPDNWKFSGPITSIYRQIGNAVPVGMLVQVFKQINKSFI